MHLVIQIPCHNEAQALPRVLEALPTSIPGIDRITRLVVDDGSTDGTSAIAWEHGADVVLCLPQQGGIARAFVTGIERAVALGADVIVNIDGDNQHPGNRVIDLVTPVLREGADLVIGVRDAESLAAFSPVKRWLERFGSRVAQRISGTTVTDGPSGFRALSRNAAMRLHVFNRHTYTLETLIQAGQLGMVVATVPIHSPLAERPSRVVRTIWGYVFRQALTMIRVFMVYRPFKFFAVPGMAGIIGGVILAARYLVLYAIDGRGGGRLQSLLLAAVLAGVGSALVVVGLLADLMAVNRRLLEDIDWRVKRLEYDRRSHAPTGEAV